MLQHSEHLPLFARLGVLQRLKVLDLSPLSLCHVVPQEIVLDRANALFLFSITIHRLSNRGWCRVCLAIEIGGQVCTDVILVVGHNGVSTPGNLRRSSHLLLLSSLSGHVLTRNHVLRRVVYVQVKILDLVR